MRYPVRSPSPGFISVETKRPCMSGFNFNNANGIQLSRSTVREDPGIFSKLPLSSNAPKQKLNGKQGPSNIPSQSSCTDHLERRELYK